VVKTREFGQPCRAPEPGRCRICRRTGDDIWADETGTLCVSPECVEAARKELNLAEAFGPCPVPGGLWGRASSGKGLDEGPPWAEPA